jgi:Fe-S cluster assembly protein NifU
MSAEHPWAYAEKVKDHFMHPRNILEDEAGYQEDGKGFVGNVKCGDQMMVVIQVDSDQGVISDCKWKTYGCASAIASTSVLSEMVIGMPLDHAYNLSPKEIMDELGGLPENKVHCSVLGDKALREAINDYYRRKGMDDKVEVKESILVCKCMNVRDEEIEHAVLEGARNFYQLQEMTKVGTGCGECVEEVKTLLETYMKQHFG